MILLLVFFVMSKKWVEWLYIWGVRKDEELKIKIKIEVGFYFVWVVFIKSFRLI